MESYKVEWRRSTKKDMRRIPAIDVERIVRTVAKLGHDSHPTGSKKMVGSECAYRLRIGTYRVIYEIYSARVVIEAVKVGHRKDIYR